MSERFCRMCGTASAQPWETDPNRRTRLIRCKNVSPQGGAVFFCDECFEGLSALKQKHHGFTCQMCGAVAGEPHPEDPSRRTRLHLGHIIDKSHGGTDDASNLRAVCSVCNEGATNITLKCPTAHKLLVQIRRAPGNDQIEVLKWLITKFPKQAAGLAKPAEVPRKRKISDI